MAAIEALQAFYDRCKTADWYYAMSDDRRAYRNGKAEMARLSADAKTSVEHQAIYDAWKAHVSSGKPWGTEQAPEPVRP